VDSVVAEPAPGLNTAFCFVIFIVGVAVLAFSLAALLNFYVPSGADANAPVGLAISLPIGIMLVALAGGLFRLKSWAWRTTVIFFGLSAVSNALYIIMAVANGLLGVMIEKMFAPPIYMEFIVRTGGPAGPFLGLLILKPIPSLVIQALIFGYYMSIRDRFNN
jgi:hypothetical protein